MRSAVLVNPPSETGTTANREGASGLGNVYGTEGAFFYPPHVLVTVAAVLLEKGWELAVVDAVAEHLDTEAAVSRIRGETADFVGVFVSYATREEDSSFLRALREQMPKANVIALGPATVFIGGELFEPKVHWKSEYRPPGIVARGTLFGAPDPGSAGPGHGWGLDAVLLGEPEGLFGPACEMLAGMRYSRFSPAGLGSLPVESSAEGHQAEFRPIDIPGYDVEGRIQDLSTLPYPAWELLPTGSYRFMTVLGSRGCESHCAYCPYVVAQGNRFRYRDAESVVTELCWLVQRVGARRIVFRDPAFAHDRQRVVDICHGILGDPVLGKKVGRSFSWECESRPEHFDADLLRWMKRAGCGWVKIGLETTSERVLETVRRLNAPGDAVAYRTHVANLMDAARRIGLPCRVFVMGGLPGQTESEYTETAEFVRRIRPTALNVMVAHSYPDVRVGVPAEGDEQELKRQMAPLFELKTDLEREAVTDGRRAGAQWRRYWRRIGQHLRRG